MTDSSRSSPVDATLLHAYIDNELDTASALEVARRIEMTPALAAEVARTEALRETLRQKLAPEALPSHLRARIEKTIGISRRSKQPTWTALAASVAGALIAGGAATWIAVHPGSGDRFFEGGVDNHIRALMAPQPADVSSSERHTVKPWFNGRVPVSPRVVDLAPDGFPLIGGRIDVIDAQPVPTLVYGRRKHVISLTAIPDTGGAGGLHVARPANGYNIVSWRSDGTAYIAVSDLNAGELQAFAEKFRSAP